MGWASGSRLAEEVLDVVFDYVRLPLEREDVARTILKLFADEDCDTLGELQGRFSRNIDRVLREEGYLGGDDEE
jgi:hypothetical protein